jgi:hypothetical protein
VKKMAEKINNLYIDRVYIIWHTTSIKPDRLHIS